MNGIQTEIRRRLSRVKPWLGVAIVLGIGLLAYYSFLGMRYLSTSESISSLNREISEVSRTLRAPAPSTESLDAERDLQKQRLEAVRVLSTALHSDELVGIVVATARETSTPIQRIVVGSTRQEELGDIVYAAQSINLDIVGEAEDIFGFLNSVRRKLPLTRVPSAQIAAPGSASAAHVSLMFLQSAAEDTE